jgi:hypothetical protein
LTEKRHFQTLSSKKNEKTPPVAAERGDLELWGVDKRGLMVYYFLGFELDTPTSHYEKVRFHESVKQEVCYGKLYTSQVYGRLFGGRGGDGHAFFQRPRGERRYSRRRRRY